MVGPSQEIVVCLYFHEATDILDELTCVETRPEDIKNLTLPNQISEMTVPERLQGAHLEIQFESGSQQGGHSPCLGGVKIDQISDL